MRMAQRLGTALSKSSRNQIICSPPHPTLAGLRLSVVKMVLDNRISESLMLPPAYEEESGNDNSIGHLGNQFAAFTAVLRTLHSDCAPVAGYAAQYGRAPGVPGDVHGVSKGCNGLQRERSRYQSHPGGRWF